MNDDSEGRVANAERAMNEAEARHARELAALTRTMHTYLRVWIARDGGQWVSITQDELRAAAERLKDMRIAFEVQPDGETLRISEVPRV